MPVATNKKWPHEHQEWEKKQSVVCRRVCGGVLLRVRLFVYTRASMYEFDKCVDRERHREVEKT